ncbi:putative sortilin [Neospora caninum Liverpool]|uniref:Putative sortilin n=1 Tax=Neospora caninum (strain Liverpool) TaxID=572307 RepID=F0VC40_NEOCL|nr:putative sortilin [Neospora caninum Liverpool]CBZ51174.1 putative sortilin [Neospora caninum Liverpool]CEL68485.1 TPA: sortilin, putative [Neospora caninum Liverpool]|eukprot:XP_003881207.1 putative sortilin [Neospora caninum Liverpool]
MALSFARRPAAGVKLAVLVAFLAVFCPVLPNLFSKEDSLGRPVPRGVLVTDAAAYANKKVSVSEVSFDSHIEDIQWCGVDHRTILLKTRRGRLYRSQDGGKSWTEITDLLKPSEGSSAAVAVDSIIVSPVDKRVVLIVGSKRNHFISEDSAATFRRLKYKNTIHNFHFHPTRPKFAILSTWTDACYASGGSGTSRTIQQDCNHQLFYTRDLGRSFKLVADYVVQFSWGDKKLGNTDHIFFTQHRGRSGDQPRYGGWSKNVDLMYTPDFGATITRLVYRGNKFLLSNGYFFVAKVKDAGKQTVSLLVSTDGGKSFQMAKLPVEIEERSYTVLDTSEDAIMLHVNHGHGSKGDTGNVYISDAKGVRYSLSLPNNIRTSTGECEFDKVLSLEGVYLANFKDTIDASATGSEGAASEKNQVDAAGEKLTEEEIEEEAEGVQVDLEKKHRSVATRSRQEEVIRTVISFDKGGVWSYLKAPRVDSRGQKIDCPPDRCWLHLNGITRFSDFAPFYSVENAVGIIMGTGNVGSYLRPEKDEANTYLSRDGGVTWIEAHKGAFIYEMGDHGGLLVMADDTKKTNQVVFSWNEGQSWYDFELGASPLFVDNIVIEPNASSVEFLLYGKREQDTAGVLFHLDFNALNQQQCKGIWAADSVSSDYETWSPSDGRAGGEKCILGKHITYTRRKQTSECFNGRDFDRPKVSKVCPCTMEDYECEFGFARSIGSTQCVATDAAAAAAATATGLAQFTDENDAAAAAACTSSSFFYTSAYRKVPGDVCEGGWMPEKVAVPCPAHSPVSRGGKTVLLLLLFIVVVMIVINYLSKTGKLKKFFRNAGFDNFANVSYGLVGGSAAGPGSWLDQEAGEGRRGEELGDRSKYEPELGFIEAEQDENEEDAPTLMTYGNAAGGQRANSGIASRSPKRKEEDEFEFEDAGRPLFPSHIPRLAPPRFDEENVELL